MKRGRKIFLKQEKPEIKLKPEPGTISSRITPAKGGHQWRPNNGSDHEQIVGLLYASCRPDRNSQKIGRFYVSIRFGRTLKKCEYSFAQVPKCDRSFAVEKY